MVSAVQSAGVHLPHLLVANDARVLVNVVLGRGDGWRGHSHFGETRLLNKTTRFAVESLSNKGQLFNKTSDTGRAVYPLMKMTSKRGHPLYQGQHGCSVSTYHSPHLASFLIHRACLVPCFSSGLGGWSPAPSSSCPLGGWSPAPSLTLRLPLSLVYETFDLLGYGVQVEPRQRVLVAATDFANQGLKILPGETSPIIHSI